MQTVKLEEEKSKGKKTAKRRGETITHKTWIDYLGQPAKRNLGVKKKPARNRHESSGADGIVPVPCNEQTRSACGAA